MVSPRNGSVLVAGLLALAGCSGGGGDDPEVPNLAVITAANAPEIAGAVMNASIDGSALAAFASFGPGGVPGGLGKASPVRSKTAEIQHAHVLSVLKQSAAGLAQATLDPEMTQCTGGGTVTASGNIATPLTLSPNDTLLFVFASCVEDGVTVSGRFAMRVTSFSGDLLNGASSIGVSVDLTNLASTVEGETVTANGALAIAVSTNSAGTVSTTVTSSLFSLDGSAGTMTLRGYSVAKTVDTVTGAFTLDAGGTLTTTALSGSVTFDVTVPLNGTGGSFPSAGEVVINGVNHGTIKVAVLDEMFVRLSIDANGDGVVDSTVDKAWDELL